MVLLDQGTDYLELHWFPYFYKDLSPKIAPKVGQIFKILKMYHICFLIYELLLLPGKRSYYHTVLNTKQPLSDKKLPRYKQHSLR